MSTPGQQQRIFEKAKWIWPDNPHWDLHNCYALFRKTFSLGKIPARAPLFITADQSYRLFVNGQYVCGGPARGFQKSWPYDEVDVAPFLKRGKNTIAVRAHNPGGSNFQYVSAGYAGLLVAARWKQVQIASDKSWRARRQSGVNPSTVPTSLQLFHQEHIDLRLEDPDWMQPGFDDSSWTAPLGEITWNAMPWYQLEPRGIPLLREIVVKPERQLGIQSGKSAAGYKTVRNISPLFAAEGLTHEQMEGEPAELTIASTGVGRFRRVLLDFGTMMIGCVGMEIDGAKGGEIVDTLHVEVIEPKSLAPYYLPDAYCRMAFSHRLICRAGKQTHTFHHPFGFRYMVLSVRDSKGPLRIRPFLRTMEYPLEITGRLRSSDERLNRIWKACARTQQVCSIDAFVDTPWREQAQWWGDARVQAWNTFHLSGDSRLFRRGIRQIAGQVVPNGLTYGHAPTIAHGCILPDFSLTWILTLWDYYWQTGSVEPLLAHEKVAWGILDYFQGMTDPKSGLATYDKRYWLFLDWAELSKEGAPSLLNLWLLIALQKLAGLYQITGAKEKQRILLRRIRNLRRALGALINSHGLLLDGLDNKGRKIPKTSVHSQTLALTANLPRISARNMLEQVILPYVREQKVFEAKPSAYWITYVFTVLQRYGYHREVVDFIAKYWTPMAEHGTTWENYEPLPGDTSYSHAWSAHPLYHLAQTLGGLTQTAPAWRAVHFEPQFFTDTCSVRIPTPLGLIESSWKKTGARAEGELVLPKGATAQIKLPGQSARTVTKRFRWKVEAND